MSDNRDGKFVVPVKPAAASGWWIGQVIRERSAARKLNGDEAALCFVNLLWVENPERSLSSTILVFKRDLAGNYSPI